MIENPDRRTVDFHNEDRGDLLAQVAELYYLKGKDQRAIAEEVGTSRSNVSRLLTEARRKGIVEIRIHRPLGRRRTLENDLIDRFGLIDARVLATAPRTTGATVWSWASRGGHSWRRGSSPSTRRGRTRSRSCSSWEGSRGYRPRLVATNWAGTSPSDWGAGS